MLNPYSVVFLKYRLDEINQDWTLFTKKMLLWTSRAWSGTRMEGKSPICLGPAIGSDSHYYLFLLQYKTYEMLDITLNVIV